MARVGWPAYMLLSGTGPGDIGETPENWVLEAVGRTGLEDAVSKAWDSGAEAVVVWELHRPARGPAGYRVMRPVTREGRKQDWTPREGR